MRGMGTWTMGWGDDGEGIDPPPLPYEDWVPQPVTPGAVRAVSVVIHGFYGLPADALLVAWDDQRATVRLANGDLRWSIDAARQAFPQQGEIAVVDASSVYPRGNRYMDALAVRSLQDLIETVNAETVTSIDEDGTIHIYGEHDNSRGEAVRAPDSGIILRASGVEGTNPWRLEVVATRLLEEAQVLLEPMNVAPPTL
jgi:hypothetical protein